jgi:hypothetical protein
MTSPSRKTLTALRISVGVTVVARMKLRSSTYSSLMASAKLNWQKSPTKEKNGLSTS